jgi:hypothetical protein
VHLLIAFAASVLHPCKFLESNPFLSTCCNQSFLTTYLHQTRQAGGDSALPQSVAHPQRVAQVTALIAIAVWVATPRGNAAVLSLPRLSQLRKGLEFRVIRVIGFRDQGCKG